MFAELVGYTGISRFEGCSSEATGFNRVSQSLVLACLISTIAVGCGHQAASEEERLDALLMKCPAWAGIQSQDSGTERKILASLGEIATHDVTAVRKALVMYLGERDTSKETPLDRLSKVFVLNRYLFNVPQYGASDAPVFGAWRSPPSEGKRNLLWPFTLGGDGRLHLTGVFTGYTGEEYDALGEFDYFLKVFGLRHPRN